MRQSLVALQERAMSLWAHRIARYFGAFALLALALVLLYSSAFGPVDRTAFTQEFIVRPDESSYQVAHNLEDAGLVRFWWAFQIAFLLSHEHDARVRAGGYQISGQMDTGAISDVLGKAPYLVWFTFEPGERREELGELLAYELLWTRGEAAEWLATTTDAGPFDGVFYPDVYLIPSDQAPQDIAARFRARFSEATESLELDAIEQGLDWDEVIVLASIVEREAAKNDKPLVAGILNNRLKREMPLAVDATLQYMEGKTEGGWWAAPDPDTKYIDSPFNTYDNVGLPPHAIATPSLESIAAVIAPAKTSCLFYIHDARGRIHCSPTYAGHKANIDRYLR